MYDTFSADYDRFVNWQSRLDYELPFIERLLSQLKRDEQPLRVLDAACGTGMHAIALARRGVMASGADVSAGMIARARENATAAGAPVPFEQAGFGALAAAFGEDAFDAVLCLGNSLPHLLAPEEVQAALDDFAACLRPGGLALIQNRNFDAVLASRQRWMEPQAYREGELEQVFVRFYDFEPDGLIRFNILTLARQDGGWRQSVSSTYLRPQLQADLAAAMARAGFKDIQSYGGLAGETFDAKSSGNLVVSGRALPFI